MQKVKVNHYNFYFKNTNCLKIVIKTLDKCVKHTHNVKRGYKVNVNDLRYANQGLHVALSLFTVDKAKLKIF